MIKFKVISLSSLLVLFISFQGITILAGCNGSNGKETKHEPFSLNDTMMKLIATDSASVKPVYGAITLNGEVTANADKIVKVFPLVSGNVDEVTAELGDYVHKGQVLAKILSGEAAGFSSDKTSAEANLQIAQKNYDAAQEMYKSGLLSEKELTTSQSELNKAKAESQKATQVMSIYPVSNGSEYIIKAPADGYLIEKNVTKGMQVRTDNTQNLFTISGLDDIWVMVNIYESDISKIKEGDAATITTLSYPDSTFHGKIDKIYNVLDPDSKVLKARIVLKNTKGLLKPEMYAQVIIDFSENKNMVAVPSSAIIFDHSKNYVVLYHDRNHLQWREVNVYGTKGNITYISSGLAKGDVIIVKNSSLVFNAINN